MGGSGRCKYKRVWQTKHAKIRDRGRFVLGSDKRKKL